MSLLDDEWSDHPAPPPAPTQEDQDAATGSTPAEKKSMGGGKKKKKKEPPPLVFATVGEFVSEFLAPHIRRNLRGTSVTWCPSWWRHPEAVSRLTAMWRAWENLRQDPATGISVWWLHHADPHLRVLLDADGGPFYACGPERGHSLTKPLPLDAPDPALWLSPAYSKTSEPAA